MAKMAFTLDMLLGPPPALPLDTWFWSEHKGVTQFYSHKVNKGKHYMLYLKWKDWGPWRAFVVENATSADDMLDTTTLWRPDIEVRQFRSDEVEEAMKAVEQAWKRTL